MVDPARRIRITAALSPKDGTAHAPIARPLRTGRLLAPRF